MSPSVHVIAHAEWWTKRPEKAAVGGHGPQGPRIDSRRAGHQATRELVFTQWSAHRWNRVNGDAGLGPKAGLETQGSLDGTVCHPYPFQMPPHSYFKTLWSQKALLFSTD